MSTLKLNGVPFHVLLVLVVSSLFSTLSWSQNTETPPLILNGDFSTWVPDKQNEKGMLPAYWQAQTPDQSAVTFAADEKQAPRHEPSLSITTQNTEAQLTQQLQRLPGRRFTISGKYKKEAISVSADITLQLFYKKPRRGTGKVSIFSSPLNTDSNKWQSFSEVIYLSDEVIKVVLTIKVKGTGKFWLDDLVTEEKTPAVKQPIPEKVDNTLNNAAANGTVRTDVIAPIPSVALSNAALETNPAIILTPAFLRSCVYIAHGPLQLKLEGDRIYGTFPIEGYSYHKGTDDFRGRGIAFGDQSNWKSGENVLIFTRLDPVEKRAVAVGKLPPTPQNILRVKQLRDLNPDVEFSFTSSKPSYAVGEDVVVRWNIKNVSGSPLSLYTGQFATGSGFHYDRMTAGTSDVAARERPVFVELQNGNAWTWEQRVTRKFPVGTVDVRLDYSSDDAFKDNLKALPQNLVFIRKSQEFPIEINELSKQQVQEVVAGLNSPRWNEQLKAAQNLWLSEPTDARLEAFTNHPYKELRKITARVLVKRGVLTPALKALLYDPQVSTTVIGEIESFRGTKSNIALAILALEAVDAEAQTKGFIPDQGQSTNTEVLLAGLDDWRIGDLLADRLKSTEPMAGGLNNGAILLQGSGLRDRYNDWRLPLPAELKTKVLAAWKLKRAKVVQPFTLAQLNAEMIIVRKMRYDNFSQGPFYATVAPLLEQGLQSGFTYSSDYKQWTQQILALPKEAAPDLLLLLKRREVSDPPRPVLQFLAKSGLPSVYVYLAQVAYNEQNSDGDSRIEAIQLMAEIDFERSKTHLENFFSTQPQGTSWSKQAPRMGAALALAKHGEKRSVPIIFSPEYEKRFSFLDDASVGAALKTVTEREFPNLTQWQRWWQREGSTLKWE